MKYNIHLSILALMMLLSVNMGYAQTEEVKSPKHPQHIDISLSLGAVQGERISPIGFHMQGQVTYRFLPYLGVNVNASTMLKAQSIGYYGVDLKPEHDVSTFSRPMHMGAVENRALSIFLGIGVSLLPIGIWVPETPHLLYLEGGVGYAQCNYMEFPNDLADVNFHSINSLFAYFCDVRYVYKFHKYVGLGAYVSFHFWNLFSTQCGATLSVTL